jgi:hypothetical protein
LRLFACRRQRSTFGACAGTTNPRLNCRGLVSSGSRKPQVQLAPTQRRRSGAVERFAWQQVVNLASLAAGDVEGFLPKSRAFYRITARSRNPHHASDPFERPDAVVAVAPTVMKEGQRQSRRTRTVTLPVWQRRRGAARGSLLRSDTSLRLLDYRGDPPFAIDGI